jgi:RNA polymerase sigma factor (sigma-70 family)
MNDDISDDELVFLIRQKHIEATDFMLLRMAQKQDRLIHKMLTMHRYCGLDYDDLKIVAIQSLFLAIESYSPQKNKFDAYYHFLLQREIVNELKRFSAPNHQPINSAYSLDFEIEEGSTMADVIGLEDPSIKSRLDDPFYQLLESNDHRLEPVEEAILIYVRKGYSYSEIGKLMHRSYRQISRIVHRLLNQTKQKNKPLYD